MLVGSYTVAAVRQLGLLNPGTRADVLESASKCQWRRSYDLPKPLGKVIRLVEFRALPDFGGGGDTEVLRGQLIEPARYV